MKLSEFVLTAVKGEQLVERRYFADVTVTTGVLWWKKVTRRKVCRGFAGSWFFLDTGEYAPSPQIENLARAYEAANLLKGEETP